MWFGLRRRSLTANEHAPALPAIKKINKITSDNNPSFFFILASIASLRPVGWTTPADQVLPHPLWQGKRAKPSPRGENKIEAIKFLIFSISYNVLWNWK
jgi:hypothetical protein